jgi:hypothetical protein
VGWLIQIKELKLLNDAMLCIAQAIKRKFIADQIKDLKLLNDAMLCIAQAIKCNFIAGQIKRKLLNSQIKIKKSRIIFFNLIFNALLLHTLLCSLRKWLYG